MIISLAAMRFFLIGSFGDDDDKWHDMVFLDTI
jgi:hypothetical protein